MDYTSINPIKPEIFKTKTNLLLKMFEVVMGRTTVIYRFLSQYVDVAGELEVIDKIVGGLATPAFHPPKGVDLFIPPKTMNNCIYYQLSKYFLIT